MQTDKICIKSLLYTLLCLVLKFKYCGFFACLKKVKTANLIKNLIVGSRGVLHMFLSTWTQTSISWEEGTSVAKLSPSDWPVSISMGHFLV